MEWLLPQEVSDIIVDFAAEEGYSLNNFALMSRSLLHRTRSRRFHRVSVTIEQSSDECKKLYDVLLMSEDIRPFVKSLFLCGLPYAELLSTSTESLLGETSLDATQHSTLLALTQLLPALEEFHLKHFPRTMLPHEFFLQIHRKCTDINKIFLDNVTFASYSVFTSFIRAFPKLKALHLKSVSTAVDSESWEDLQGYAMTPQAAINALDVNLSEESILRVCHDICEEDDAPVSIAHLQTLRISDIKQLSHWDCVTDMVQKSAKTLQNLQVRYIQTDVEVLPIMPLSSLKHLHIHLDVFKEYVDILGRWIQCFEDTAANSVRLEKITITIKAYSLDRDRVAESQLPDLITMQEEELILGQWFQYENPSDGICLPKDDIWCDLDACLPLLTDELVIKFARARPNDPFKNRIDQLKEIIRGRMRRFKNAGGFLVFEVEPV